jgi:hypothetical protein
MTKDFDVCCKVVSIFEMDEYTNELKLSDHQGEYWYCLALKLKLPEVRANQVVRIRSAQYDPSSTKQMLVLQHFSNIMQFVSTAKVIRTHSKLTDDWS